MAPVLEGSLTPGGAGGRGSTQTQLTWACPGSDWAGVQFHVYSWRGNVPPGSAGL